MQADQWCVWIYRGNSLHALIADIEGSDVYLMYKKAYLQSTHEAAHLMMLNVFFILRDLVGTNFRLNLWSNKTLTSHTFIIRHLMIDSTREKDPTWKIKEDTSMLYWAPLFLCYSVNYPSSCRITVYKNDISQPSTSNASSTRDRTPHFRQHVQI